MVCMMPGRAMDENTRQRSAHAGLTPCVPRSPSTVSSLRILTTLTSPLHSQPPRNEACREDHRIHGQASRADRTADAAGLIGAWLPRTPTGWQPGGSGIIRRSQIRIVQQPWLHRASESYLPRPRCVWDWCRRRGSRPFVCRRKSRGCTHSDDRAIGLDSGAASMPLQS